MSAACHLEPARKPPDRRAFIGDVGRRLSARHGIRKYYKADQVRLATRDAGYPIEYVRWADCIYLTPHDFHAAHAAAGGANDYAAMKASVLSDLAADGSFQGADLDLSWLEWPDIDVSALFDWFDFS